MPLPRPMDATEQARFLAAFPALNVLSAVVTGEIDFSYNCLAWTLEFTTVWIWPGNSLSDFDKMYALRGYVRADDGPIAAYGVSKSEMTHGAVSGAGHGPRWESKCGSDLRIQHGLDELEGSHYGRVRAHYRPGLQARVEESLHKLSERIAKGKTVKTYLTKEQNEALEREVAQIPENVRTNYRRAFERWKESWFRGGLRVTSNPASRRVGAEFDALIAMGPAILPLVVQSLAEPPNFFALQLYDSVQTNARLLVQYGSDDERILEGEQGRARRTVQAWFTNR